ncbi:hypothetical protein OWM07_10210 [Deferribacter thermophilus]
MMWLWGVNSLIIINIDCTEKTENWTDDGKTGCKLVFTGLVVFKTVRVPTLTVFPSSEITPL